jgi:hypothetical protein
MMIIFFFSNPLNKRGTLFFVLLLFCIFWKTKCSSSNWCNKEGGRDHPLSDGMLRLTKNSYHHYHLWHYYLFFLILFFVPRVYITSNRGSFLYFHFCLETIRFWLICRVRVVRLTDSNLRFPVNNKSGIVVGRVKTTGSTFATLNGRW